MSAVSRRRASGAVEDRPDRAPTFRREIRAARRYERNLAVKAALALVLVAVIVTVRTLYFA